MSGSGSGGDYINVGGINISISDADPNVPYAQEILDISLCAAILQLATRISNSNFSSPIQTAAVKALGLASGQLTQETNGAGPSSSR